MSFLADHQWWKNAVIYQVYPRSFKDTNGDGIGDIPGVIEKLDYIRKLGATAIWLNPIFESPHVDNGYDVRNYEKIDPGFGTMEDAENLIKEAKKHGLKIILDLVLNHTSDQHPWFRAARKSKDSPYRDFYIWRDPKDGREPTDWASFFGGSTWAFDEQTGQYYFHLFSDKMPDLNWENPKVREEMVKIARFWLEKGVDGFRLDAVIHMAKDSRFLPVRNEDAEDETDFVLAEKYYANLPRVHDFIHEFNRAVKKDFPDAFLIGETASADTNLAVLYSSPAREECDAVITFNYLGFDTEAKDKRIPENWQQGKWNLAAFKKVMAKWQKDLYGKGYSALYWNNHDMPRLLSRFGDEQMYREKSAKMLATLMYLQWGLPILLQGEEIGMTNLKLPHLEDYEDPSIPGLAAAARKAGCTDAEILQMVQKRSKDTSRGAMQWTDEKYGGFSTYAPWLGINDDTREVNAAIQEKDPDSILQYYRKLLEIKKSMDVFKSGTWEMLAEHDPNIYAYLRTYNRQRALVVCNVSKERQTFTCPELTRTKWSCLLNNAGNSKEIPGRIVLSPYECYVLLQKNEAINGRN
ncbi:glycoside hydrolase family 13 protein [Heyndrickxia acidiproducens]|uniref:glycoside hydrolase family 13 protein n=1 Tax=Heyndrickxia acidiproducens TaxID=1121084 RepID=UPI003BF54486